MKKKSIKINALSEIIEFDKKVIDGIEALAKNRLSIIDNLEMEIRLLKEHNKELQKKLDAKDKEILTLVNSCNAFNDRLDSIIDYVEDMKN